MRKYLVLFMCTLAAAGIASCSRETPLSAAQDIYADIMANAEKTTENLQKANSGKEAGDALVAYATEMKKLAERSEALQKKYPDFDEKSVPEMKEPQEKMEKTMKAFADEMRKSMAKYAGDKDFIGLVMQMSKIMNQMR